MSSYRRSVPDLKTKFMLPLLLLPLTLCSCVHCVVISYHLRQPSTLFNTFWYWLFHSTCSDLEVCSMY